MKYDVDPFALNIAELSIFDLRLEFRPSLYYRCYAEYDREMLTYYCCIVYLSFYAATYIYPVFYIHASFNHSRWQLIADHNE